MVLTQVNKKIVLIVLQNLQQLLTNDRGDVLTTNEAALNK